MFSFQLAILGAGGGGGGGEGVLSFFFIRWLGPSIYFSSPNNQEYQAPQKYLKFKQPRKYPPFCTLTI